MCRSLDAPSERQTPQRVRSDMRRSQGFTLLELVLVLSLMVAITAIAATSLRSGFRIQRLLKAAEQVRSEWARARNEAIKNGRVYVFHHALEGRRFLIMQQTSLEDTWPSLGDEFGQMSQAGQPRRLGTATRGLPNAPYDTMSADPWQQPDLYTIRQKELPEHVLFLGANVKFDQRSMIQMNQTIAPALIEQTSFGSQLDLGEDSLRDQNWGTPVYFFPDGSSSTAELILLNDRNEAIRVYLRGLTGTVRIGKVERADQLELPGALR